MFLAVFTALLNRDSEKIDNPEERQIKYKTCQYSSDVAAANTASSSYEQNRIVHILFCLKAHNVFVLFLIQNFFSWCLARLLPWKKPVGSCTGLNQMIPQLNKKIDENLSSPCAFWQKCPQEYPHTLETTDAQTMTQGSLHLLLLNTWHQSFLSCLIFNEEVRKPRQVTATGKALPWGAGCVHWLWEIFWVPAALVCHLQSWPGFTGGNKVRKKSVGWFRASAPQHRAVRGTERQTESTPRRITGCSAIYILVPWFWDELPSPTV